jgi:hypothetical protein
MAREVWTMLFQVNYRVRAGGSATENEASARRAQALFAKWSPPTGFEVKSFYARVDGAGGSLVVETDDAKLLLDGSAKFGFFNDFEVVPIVDISEAVAVQNAALDWVASS